MADLIPIEIIEHKIYLIRGQKVMLDKDLAALYAVSTKRLNQAVKRNIIRFPSDFMFSLSRQEILRMSQFVTSSMRGEDKLKFSKNVNVFTEQGIAMLSSVLHSKESILVNIAIMRAFVRLRQIISSHNELALKIAEIEKKYSKHELEITTVFKILKRLMDPQPDKPTKRIGFILD